jgi:immune inhibitor A
VRLHAFLLAPEKSVLKKLLALITSLTLLLSVAGTAAAKTPELPNTQSRNTDNLKNPLAEKQAALKATAREKVAKGEATPKGDNKVVKVAPGQYVQLAFTGSDSIFTVLGEFSDLAHNQIAEPDRSVDNTTKWEPDFSPTYYKDMLFDQTSGDNSMANYYLEQSSGRYTVEGDVTDWVQVPQTGAYYGSNTKSDAYAWVFIRDELTAWVQAQHDAGKTDAEIADYLSQFDQWDRYDNDGDGIVNEPDGYIDHFQTIHSGEGEEAGGGVLGDDAIWSHRWYAFYGDIGATGPSPDYLLGGIQIPGTNYWIGDYTIEPENGGVGVFSHEFAHDLGLPDEYDTSGNSGGAENSTGFWTLMSSGSWGNNGKTDEGIGDRPFHMNAWDKWALGWLNYDAVFPGQATKSVKLGPAETTTKQAQAMIVVLPDKEVTKNVGSPFDGSSFYYSGAANDLDTTMTKSFDLPAAASLSAKVRYSIESGYDYAYVTVDGAKVSTNLSNSSVATGGIDGHSAGWVDLTVDLPAGHHDIGFGYWTDGGVQGDGDGSTAGFAIDNIAITGQAVDGAESDAGWTCDSNSDSQGFHVTSGTETFTYFNAYVAENRQYWGYDAGLAGGPYNFTTDLWAERFPYQDGLLVWYYDSSYADNSVGDHPGEGEILPVDARPDILHWADDGTNMRGRFQPFDATFGTPAQSITLHHNGVATTIPAQKAVNVFDDMRSYYRASDPADAFSHYQAGWFSVNHPHTGTVIRVKSVTPGGMMQIEVTPPAA